MFRQREQGLPQLRVAPKPLRSAHQPKIQLVIEHPRFTHQLGVIALGIIDQVAGMHLEELRQQLAGRVGQVRAGATLDLRQVRLAQLGLEFHLDCAH